MGKKLHVYTADDVTRSVLEGVPVTANCGLTKVLTKKSIDKAATTSAPPCKRCMEVIAELTKTEEVTIGERKGWLGHLEERTRRRGYSVTVKSSATTWTYSTKWQS